VTLQKQVETIDDRWMPPPIPRSISSASTPPPERRIRFDLVTDESSSRRRVVKQQPRSSSRSVSRWSNETIAFDDGVQAGSSLAHGSSIVLSLASVLGLNDRAPASLGFTTELLSDSKWFLDELLGEIISEL